MRYAMILMLLAAPAFAECPLPEDTSREMLNLIARANDTDNRNEGRRIAGQMWQVWLRAPDATAQETLDAGMRRRDSYDFAGALKEFDRLAAYCPDYAEGFNQRAYIHFLQENYEKALIDLDIALGLSPYHIAAQAGRALTLMNLGRLKEARAQLLIAVDNNPWLSERALLAEGAPLGPVGKDI
ncbi:hypothetical protein H9Q16_02690 [Sulfitobacter sp. TSTF-M16]|uniref:Tetratricopeptide repeat protein n=3 Tax=Sulfitobacter aestuariivivens TaxID=2766981 RepID=A0A927D0I5_9RHOB|nr:hypothetical protein [Sulfitobacter aestuariivivens]MBD3662820.1 hypothetical protein [Sulfitobacter aestuariivivens]